MDTHVKTDGAITGWAAKWYASQSRNDIPEFRKLAERLAKETQADSKVLEIAFGPGYLSVELARLGRNVTGLDLSSDFVRIATENAREAGVKADFRYGNVSAMPFESDLFDLIVCRAAFKNFATPLEAINEMHRVLRPGGKALIMDLFNDASLAEIDRYLESSGRSWLNAFLTKQIFRRMLIPRAYLQPELEELAKKSRFGSCRIDRVSFGFELWLEKRK